MKAPSERARAFAEGIGLAWPWKGPSGPGRPNMQVVYERTLANALQRRDWSFLEGVTSVEVPQAWREGMPVGTAFQNHMQARAAEMLAHQGSCSTDPAAAAEPAPEADAEEQADPTEKEEEEAAEEGEEEEEGGPAAKKRKTTRPKGFVPPDAVEWFVEWSNAMMKKPTPGWTRVRCWREARALCPQIFGHVHFSTYRRWKGRPKAHYTAGRRRRLSPLQEQSLRSLAMSLAKAQVPFSLDMFTALASKKLSLKVSRSWSYRFLRSLRLRWKSTKQGSKAKQYTETEASRLQYQLSAKLWWLLDQKGVRPERLFNMDETSLALLPLSNHGWQEAGQQRYKSESDEAAPVAVPEDKAAITCSLIVGFGAGAPAYAQLIYTGKTHGSHPIAPVPENIMIDHTETHWQSTRHPASHDGLA